MLKVYYLLTKFIMSSELITKPIYQKIAIDIANRIVSGHFAVGTKIYGRSTLSSEYNVSPETIRRAINLLHDMEIVDVNKGSGIIVKSVDNSLKFIDKFKEIDSINLLKEEVITLAEDKREIECKIESVINQIIDYLNRFNNSSPFVPFEFEIHSGLKIIGKTASEVKFWQNTGATIIAIRRNNRLIISPGPTAVFKEKDFFIFIGNKDSYTKVKKFLYK